MSKRASMQTGGLTSLLFRVSTTRGFLGITHFAGPEPGWWTCSPSLRREGYKEGA